jgi:hypothetical protein
MTDVVDVVTLFEESPGRYEGVALRCSWTSRRTPAPTTGRPPTTRRPTTRRSWGPVRSYVIRGPPAAPSMIYETDAAGRVTSFRGGRTREVAYIEGCA